MMKNGSGAGVAVDDAMIRRLAGADLNLLVVFSALLDELSVTRTAERLFVGQPAVSASLKRLRVLFADPLLIKVGRGMVATDHALRLKTAVDDALSRIDAVAFRKATFDPVAAHSTVRIGFSDDNEIVFLPAIIDALRVLAPNIRVVARPVSHTDVRALLDDGDIDVGVSVFGALSQWHRSAVLFEQGYGCLFDPAATSIPPPSTLKRYLQRRQVIVTFDGELRGKIDDLLEQMQLRRDVWFGTARFSVLPHLVKGTDVVASLPEVIGLVLARAHGLAFMALPFDVSPSLPRMAWHVRSDLNPASKWLRETIASTVSEVVASVRKAAIGAAIGAGSAARQVRS